MLKNKDEHQHTALSFFFINVFQFVFSTSSTFLIKKTFNKFPFPYLISFLRLFFGLLILLFVNWINHGFPLNLRWIIPPKPIIGWLCYAGFVYSILAILVNTGFFVSSIDFVVIFRMSGIIFNVILGMGFLGEKITKIGFFSLNITFFGIVISLMDFQWTISRLSSYSQIIIMIFTTFVEVISSFIHKRSILLLHKINSDFTIVSFSSWEYFISLFPLLIASLLYDRVSFDDLLTIISPETLALIFFIAILGQVATVLVLQLQKMATLISFGIINQLKQVITLSVSHFIFGDTKWNLRQSFGVLLLFTGGIIYTFSHSLREIPPVEKADEINLLEKKDEKSSESE